MEDKKMQKYLRAIRRRLNMPKGAKERVMADFASSIQCRREDGQNDEAIIAELGTPRKASAELNEQMKAFTYRKSPWRWVCLVLVVLPSLSLVYGGLRGLLLAAFNNVHAATIGIIGGADGPTAIFVTTNHEGLVTTYCMSVLLLIIGIVGFIVLSRLKRK